MLEREEYLRALGSLAIDENFYLARFYIRCLVVKYEGVSLARISRNNTLTLNLSPVTNLARREGTVYTFGAV